jgi:electron transfer flavoprotein beta subunit
VNIIACIKYVPDTETKVRVKPGAREIEKEGVNYVVNPYDEFAVEEALKIKEKFGEGSVTVISMGYKKAEEGIRTCLAMGADRGIHIIEEDIEHTDPYTIAKLLYRVIKDLDYNIILCGRQAIDDDSAQVGSILAEFLNIPQGTFIRKLSISDDKKSAIVERDIEGGSMRIEVSLPAIFTTDKGLNEPRYPSLPGIMKAKKKEIKVMNYNELGLSDDEIGEKGSKIRILEMFLPPERKAGKIIEGEIPDACKELVKLLREEAKVV